MYSGSSSASISAISTSGRATRAAGPPLGRGDAVGVRLDLAARGRGEQADAQPAGVGADLVGVRAARRRGRRRGRPASAPWTASRIAAVSRTERVTTSSATSPPMTSPNSGARDTRPRDGLSPTSPQHAAGMRIEPPPSLACAAATMPAATAAAEPPLEPPVRARRVPRVAGRRRRRAARWSAGCRARGCWSCRRTRSRPRGSAAQVAVVGLDPAAVAQEAHALVHRVAGRVSGRGP